MGEPSENRLSRWLPLCGAVGAAIVVLPKTILGNDFGAFLETSLAGTFVGLILAVIFVLKFRAQALASSSMIAIFLAGSWIFFRVSDDVRTTARWLFESRIFKNDILAQHEVRGELKHAEWDSWGFAGMDTTAYLVFDPDDSLAAASTKNVPGKYDGIPCEVPTVRRLESRWYAVQFYTNTDWHHCD
jgi:hypothetical protein